MSFYFERVAISIKAGRKGYIKDSRNSGCEGQETKAKIVNA